MKGIEQTSLALLVMSLFLIVLVAAGFALHWHTSRPPLFTPPPQDKDFSYVDRMRKATSVEGLRQICTFWAEREDQSQKFVNALHSQFLSLVQQVVITLLVVGVAFTAGLTYIYLAARKMRREQPNAL